MVLTLSLVNVDHHQVISTERCNDIIEQEHRSTKATKAIPTRTQTAEMPSRTPEFARPSDQPSSSFLHQRLGIYSKK